ncbi:hypothetical protein BsWGS_16919 [Bradybaena similaris]
MLLIVFVHVCMLFVLESCSQTVILDSPNLHTPCTKGLRHGIDVFSINGTIFEDFLLHVRAGFDPVISAEVFMRDFQDFYEMCTIEIGENAEFCGTSSSSDIKSCYCSNYDNETGSVEFMLSNIADITISEAVVRVRWWHSSGNVTYSRNNQTLPRIYDVSNATLVLKVNGRSITDSANCNYHIILNADNEIELCCTNMASPCYPRVTVRQYVLQGDVPACVRYQVLKHNAKLMSTMVKSYSVCTKDIYYMAGSCVAASGQVEESSMPVVIFLIFAIPVAIIIYSAGKLIYILLFQRREVEAHAPDMPDPMDRVVTAP